ncbi:MAG: DUF1566 domain-containing protein [Pseudomonadota bacterium]|nr:DUF1566 domain-containing protein [Pseudomonadota bacterium]
MRVGAELELKEDIEMWRKPTGQFTQQLIGATLLVSVLFTAQPVQAACNANMQQSTPTGQFTDHGDGTVTDDKTGLMWAQCAEGLSGSGCPPGSATTHTWQAALDLAAASTHANYTDWRLPNLKELTSIVEISCNNPAINATIFPNTPGSHFWSASPYANDSGNAWGIYFGNGYDYYGSRSSSARVRLVRGGQ